MKGDTMISSLFRTLPNVYDGMFYHESIIDVWQGSKYACGL